LNVVDEGLVMADTPAYAVMFHEGALKELGDAVRPYLKPGELGPYLLAKRIEPAMPFTLLVVEIATSEHGMLEFEVQVPSSFIKLILNISKHRPLGFTKS
jgi:hypothetical protein